MCMIGLLKHAERLRGEAGSDLVWQGLQVGRDVMEAVHYKTYRGVLQLRRPLRGREIPQRTSDSVSIA